MSISGPPSFKADVSITLACASFEILLYGINIVLFGCCVCILLKKDGATNKILLYSSIVSFILSTSHVIITLVGLIQGVEGTFRSGVYSKLSLEITVDYRLRVAGVAIYSLNEFAQDMLLIWRLFIVWDYGKTPTCLFPVVFLAGELVSGSIDFLHLYQTNADVLSHGVELYAISGWILNAAFHIYVTSGISYRLWRAGRRSAVIGGWFGYTYKGTVAMVVESGFLAVLSAIILLGCYAARDTVGLLGINVAAQMATTVPLLIVVRVRFGLKWGFTKDINPIPGPDPPNATDAIELPILSSAPCTSLLILISHPVIVPRGLPHGSKNTRR